MAVKSSPICSWGFDNETITHFSLQCPNYAVLRPDLLTAAAPIAFDQWLKYSYQQKVELFLFGSSDVLNNENFESFSHVQYFIRESKRFCISFCGRYN